MAGVQGCLLEVTVVKCNHLKNTEFESNQEDPFVCIEYGSNRFHSRTCNGFVLQEKFVFTLFEGSSEITISVYNSNTFHEDGFIGRGRVELQRVISQGYDNTTWPIFSENGRTTGEVCLMLCCPNIMTSTTSFSPYMASSMASYYTQSYTVGDHCALAQSYPPGNGGNIMSASRGLKRPLSFENYVKNEEELGRDLMRRKLTTEAEGSHLQPAQVLDIAMDERSLTALDEDTEMACGSHMPSHPYSAIWDTICF